MKTVVAVITLEAAAMAVMGEVMVQDMATPILEATNLDIIPDTEDTVVDPEDTAPVSQDTYRMSIQ